MPGPDAGAPGGDTTARVRRHVEELAGAIGERNVFRPEALRAAADYIESTWRAQGYRVDSQRYTTHGVECANLEVSRPGTSRPADILLIGAHYDSVRGSPGANDNASGVAALLEIARWFATLEPAITVRLVAFVNEEPPFFMTRRQGSAVYAKAARARGDRIVSMASLETIGYYRHEPGSQRYPPFFRFFHPDRGDFIGLVSDFRSRREMLRFAELLRRHGDLPVEHTTTFRWIPGAAWSDHLPFWRRGYRAFMVTDTAFYRYPHYHTRHDTPDRLTYPELGRATEGLARAFAALAGGV